MECTTLTTNRTVQKDEASQCAAQQEPNLLSTRSGRSHTRTRPRGARHCRESVRETGGERSRGRVWMINFRRTCGRPFAPAHAPTKGLLPFVGVTHDAPGLEEELFLVPVVVVDVGAVEALDHLGYAGVGFDGLEDTEGDENAAAFVVQADRVDDKGDVREGFGEVEGVDADLPDVVPPADMEGGGGRLPRGAGIDVREFEGDVADAGAPVGDAELARARGDGLAILAAHVRDARESASVPRSCPRPLFIRLWVAEQDTAGMLERARTSAGPLADHLHSPNHKDKRGRPAAQTTRSFNLYW